MAFRYVEPLADARFWMHDCIAEDGVFQNGVLTFYFPNGVWLLPNHPFNTTQELVRTTAAQVQFRLPQQAYADPPQIYVYRERHGKRTGRELPLFALLHGLQAGIWKLEFLELFRSGGNLRILAALHIPRRPWQRPCELILTAKQTQICWNGFDPQKVW